MANTKLVRVPTQLKRTGTPFRFARSKPQLECLELRCVLSSPGQTIAPGIVEYPVDLSGMFPIRVNDIALGADGSLWCGDISGGSVGRTAVDGTSKSFITDQVFYTQNLVLGPDDNIWFSDPVKRKIGNITTGGVFTVFPKIDTVTAPWNIVLASGPDGLIWFVTGNEVGTINSSGAVKLGTFQTTASVGEIAWGPDGNLWFTELSDHLIGKMTPDGVVTEYSFGGSGHAFSGLKQSITTGPDGNLWFTNSDSGLIGRVTLNGDVTLFNLPTGLNPSQIITGPDGNLWFASTGSNLNIGRITTAGIVSLFVVPNVYVHEIATGSDGGVWFTGEAKVGRIDPGLLGNGVSTNISVEQGAATTVVVADAVSSVPPDSSVQIDWGNGQISPGSLQADGAGTFRVLGAMAYELPGTYPVTVTIRSSASVQTTIASVAHVATNPNHDFITNVYQVLLNRSAESAGVSFWLTKLQQGESRFQITVEIQQSSEYQTGAIDQLYRRYLGRAAAPFETQAYVAMLGVGATLADAEALVLSSPEYFNRTGAAPALFLNALFHDALGRAVDVAGAFYFETLLATGQSTALRLMAVENVISSQEAFQNEIHQDYESFLNRPPEPEALRFWIATRQSGLSAQIVAAEIMASDEAFGLLGAN